jgi:hypothetical protein
MPFFHSQSRSELRQAYVDAWRKRRERQPSEPVEAQIADVIELHPEYHARLEGDALVPGARFLAGGRRIQSLPAHGPAPRGPRPARHRPASGIRAAYAALAARHSSPHDAEHILIEYLAEALWNAQRSGTAPDEVAYLDRIRSHPR